MKARGVVLACGLAAFALAGSKATVYTLGHLDPSARVPDGGQPSVSFEDARLLLAQRLDLARYYKLDEASDDILELLNKFGGPNASLFSNHEPSSRRLVVFAEGIERPEDIVPGSWAPSFHISDAADAFTPDLADELLDLDRHRRKATESCDDHSLGDGDAPAILQGGLSSNNPLGRCSIGWSVNSVDDLDIIKGDASFSMSQAFKKNLPLSYLDDSTAVFHVRFEAPTDRKSEGSADHTELILKFRQILDDIAVAKHQQSTIVIAPRPSARIGKHGKAQHSQKKRAALEPRISPMEAPIPTPQNFESSEPSSQAVNPAQSPATPKTTIPFCWASEKACMEKTVNCTGHGSCYKKYTEKVSADEEGPECWACQCAASVEELDGGSTRTTYWGGPACQKKDISVPFFLFAGFTVAALATVSWGIGLLFKMGNEDLPSVLGAGVAPVTHK